MDAGLSLLVSSWPNRLNTSVDEGKNTETILDKNLETFRRSIEFRRLLNESGRNLEQIHGSAKSLNC